jgi:hypothetical protein
MSPATPETVKKRLLLWAHPRSVSSAFERAMLSRADMTVVSDPLLEIYAIDEAPAAHRARVESVFALLMATPTTSHVFSKNMAYCLGDHPSTELLRPWTNAFIIRHPARALASHHRLNPEFTGAEAGYVALRRVFDIAVHELGQAPIVIEGTRLTLDPVRTLDAFCAAVGIPFDEASLEWTPGRVAAFSSKFRGWVEAAENSASFVAETTEPDLRGLPERVLSLIRESEEHYRYLLDYCINR